MTRTSTLTSILFFISVALLATFESCTSPSPEFSTPPLQIREGVPLEIVNGTISPSATGKPYIVDADWLIDENETVTIQPGVEIMFDGLYWLDVAGKLIARGTSEQPIIFTSARLETDLGQWRGIKLRNPNDGSVFEHCVFTYGGYFDIDTVTARGRDAQLFKGVLAVRNSSPEISRCVIVFNQNNGVFIAGANSFPRVRYNIITKNDASGIRSDTAVVLSSSQIDISYNCVSDNSAPSFLMGYDSTRWGHAVLINANLDSCDEFHNVDILPLMVDPDNRQFQLQSCSPCVDAGPDNDATQNDPDGTRADFGSIPYVQVTGELRGVVSGTLNPSIAYRMSCNLRVRPGEQLVVPAGTSIDVTGMFTIEVFGQMVVQGSDGVRSRICPCSQTVNALWGGMVFMANDSLHTDPASVLQNIDLIHYQAINVYRPGLRFESVDFEDGFNYGVLVSTGSTDLADSVSFANCTFTRSGEYGMLVDTSSATIRNTIVKDGRGRGISLNGTESGVQITNTIVRACSTSAVVMENYSNPLVVNNTFIGSGYHGIHLENNCYPVIKNTIVTLNHRYGVYSFASSLPALSYNDVFANYTLGPVTVDYYSADNTLVPGEGAISIDPQFLSGDDLHLGAGSPCRNAGDPDGAYNNGDGSRNDIGAYGGPLGASVGAPAIRYSHNYLVSK